MQLTVQDAAKFFNVSERTVYRWIKKKEIPVYRILDQFRFNRPELLEWAMSRKMQINPDFFQTVNSDEIALPSLSDAVNAGGVYYRVGGKDKESVFRNIVKLLRLPEDIDCEFLIKLLCTREEIASTGLGDGVAVPHVRNPIVINVPYSMVALCFLETPIEFSALDGKPVHCIFMLISQTVRVHLHLLSRLAFCLQDAKFKRTISTHASRGEIEYRLKKVEETLMG